MDFSRGSEWRKWDLHIHTPESYDHDYKGVDFNAILSDSLAKQGISAVAITDHFTINANRIKELRTLNRDIIFFPGVELRIDKFGVNTHVILIFSEQTDLKALQEDFNVFKRSKAKNSDDDEKIHWTFEHVIEFAKTQNALVSIHAGKKENGIDKVTNAIKVAQAIKEDMATNINFFEIGRKEDIESYNKKVFIEEKYRKPLIICSDNHDPRCYVLKENLWIKADLTFEGLRQTCIQPEERVYIGELPIHKQKVKDDSGFHYIDRIKIYKTDDIGEHQWFDCDLPLNSGLVAVIGNKGSGKSAFTDILSLIGGAKSLDSASFLNKERFRSEKQNFAKHYCAQIEWFDGRKTESHCLHDDYSSTEYVQYLPQKKIESICNQKYNEKKDEFQEQIDNVIFSYIDQSIRQEYNDLNGLLNSKNRLINIEIDNLKEKQIVIINKIFEIDKKRKPSYKKAIEEEIKYTSLYLDSHKKAKPVEVVQPKAIQDSYFFKLTNININIQQIEDEIKNKANEYSKNNLYIEHLRQAIKEINLEILHFDQKINEIIQLLDVPQIDKTKIKVKKSIEINEFEIVQKKLKDNNQELSCYLYEGVNGVFSEEQKVRSLKYKLNLLKEKKNLLTEKLSTEEQNYQKYTQENQLWESKLKELESQLISKNEEVNYLTSQLEDDRDKLENELQEIVMKIYDKIKEKVNIYDEIYKPVGKQMNKFLSTLDDKIEFITSINVDVTFIDNILRNINQRIRSPFAGKEEGIKFIQHFISKTNFDDKESLKTFFTDLFLATDKDEYYESIDKIFFSPIDHYNYLASLDYLKVNFELRMSGNTLASLSPGQRGSVLLVFFLALSNDDKPLIIDQPEDNLDNESIFKKLVKCILKAKKNRQIFIVTHNPNIAIACDAEQIIYCDLNKAANSIRYTSGSIENPLIKQKVIDVLEGTELAFLLRKEKYDIKD